MLGFQTETGPIRVYVSSFSAKVTVQKIAGIELHTRLAGRDFHNATSCRLVHAGGQPETYV